jgi:hypothetical protein
VAEPGQHTDAKTDKMKKIMLTQSSNDNLSGSSKVRKRYLEECWRFTTEERGAGVSSSGVTYLRVSAKK